MAVQDLKSFLLLYNICTRTHTRTQIDDFLYEKRFLHYVFTPVMMYIVNIILNYDIE